jgi:hypothetical protein
MLHRLDNALCEAANTASDILDSDHYDDAVKARVVEIAKLLRQALTIADEE